MTARAPVARDREKLRALARGLVAVSREQGLTRMVAETELEGAFVRVTTERTKIPGRRSTPGTEATRDRWEEDVTVASGPRSQPKPVFVAPAAWLEAVDA